MSSGVEVKCGLKQASAWGTPVACGAGDAMLITSENIAYKPTMDKDDSAGMSFPGAIDNGTISCDGDLGGYLRFDDMRPLAALMGAAAAPAQQGASDAYKHVLTWATDLDGIFWTLALFKGYSVHEHASVKFGQLDLSGKVGSSLEWKLKALSRNLAPNTSSGTNNLTTIADLDPVATARVRMSQIALRINSMDGLALASGDLLTGKNAPTGFALSVNRNLKGDYLGDGTDMIAEPSADGFPSLTLKLDLPEYVSDAHLQALISGAYKKADLIFTGGIVDSTYHYSLAIEMPMMRVVSGDPPAVNKGSKLKQSVSYELLKPAEAPAGMTGLTLPIRMTIINAVSAAPLA